jgi:dynein heavy chain
VDSKAAQVEGRMERIFLYCLTWALGGLLNEKERVMLDHEMRSMAGSAMPPK